MELVPVLDVTQGVAVHAQGRVRSHFAPVAKITFEFLPDLLKLRIA